MARAKTISETEKRTKYTTAELASQIDELGDVNISISILSEKAEKLKGAIKEKMEVGDVIETSKYKAMLFETIKTSLIPEKVGKLLNSKQWYEVISIAKTKAEKYLTKEQLDKCSSEPVITSILKVSKRPI